MVQFSTVIKRFAEQGEKTGWTYIEIPAAFAQQLKPNNKKTFRVKGTLDDFAVAGVALMPMGGGDFIMPLNATIRKGIKKGQGALMRVKLAVDEKEIQPPTALMECLRDEPAALAHFNSLAKSHRLYFTRWILSAKTEGTKTKRIAQAVNALAKRLHFGEMLRALKKDREELLP